MEYYALVAKYEVVPDQVESPTLCKVASAIALGIIPSTFQPYFAGGRLLGLLKPNGSIRPIVIGESFRRLVGNVLVKAKCRIREYDRLLVHLKLLDI